MTFIWDLFETREEVRIHMNKKVIIVGGVAGGATTAARLRRLDESIDIIESKGWPTDAILVEINRETIGEKFKIHIRVVGLYLQAMEKAGIIKLLGRQDGYGGRGDNIYQIGKWLQNSLKHRPKPISFLKQSPEFQQALRTFKTQ